MRFLLKSAFMIFLLLLVVPFFAPVLLDRPLSREEQALPSGRDIGGAVSAAKGTFDYMSGICDERPEVCDDSAGMLSFLGRRARQGAEIIYLYLGQHFSDSEDAELATAQTEKSLPQPSSKTVAKTPSSDETMDPVQTGAIEEQPAPAASPEPAVLQEPSLHFAGYPDKGPVPTPRPH